MLVAFRLIAAILKYNIHVGIGARYIENEEAVNWPSIFGATKHDRPNRSASFSDRKLNSTDYVYCPIEIRT